MQVPQPRTTEIVASANVEGLFYEKINGASGGDDLFVAVHYQGTTFGLLEVVEIEENPEFNSRFTDPKDEKVGIIEAIEPASEGSKQDGDNLIIRITCAGSGNDIYQVTELRKFERQS